MSEQLAVALRWLRPAALLVVAAGLLVATAGCDLGAPRPAARQVQAAPPPARPVAPESAPPGSLPLPHAVAPPSVDELQRKRAEWQEQQRQAEQSQAEMEAWRRSRRPAESGPKVRVGTAAPTGPSESERVAAAMRDWYGRYSLHAAAVSLALSQYGMAANTSADDPRRRLAACRDLKAASKALLVDPRLLQAPLDSVAAPLATAYAELEATADSCLSYRDADLASHLGAARRAMTQAATALRPFNMAP